MVSEHRTPQLHHQTATILSTRSILGDWLVISPALIPGEKLREFRPATALKHKRTAVQNSNLQDLIRVWSARFTWRRTSWLSWEGVLWFLKEVEFSPLKSWYVGPSIHHRMNLSDRGKEMSGVTKCSIEFPRELLAILLFLKSRPSKCLLKWLRGSHFLWLDCRVRRVHLRWSASLWRP